MINNNNLISSYTPAARTHGKKSTSDSNGASGAQAPLTAEPEQLPVSTTNLTAAGSPIQDEDSAKQNMEAVMSAMRAQSTTAMLAQANLKPESALRLLQQ